MKRQVKWTRLIAPLLVMAAMVFILIAENRGITFENTGTNLTLLPALSDGPVQKTALGDPMLVVINKADTDEQPFVQTMCDTLDEMRVPWRVIDPREEALPLSTSDNVIVCTRSMNVMLNQIEELVSWIDAGGNMSLCMSPMMDDAYFVLYRILGITEYSMNYEPYNAFRIKTDIIPLMKDVLYAGDSDLNDYFIPVRLQDDCVVHMETDAEYPSPLMWERVYGKGRVVVFNTALMSNKDGRGYATAIISAMEDVLVYPIINAGMIFIDDFPAPQPEGFDERILKDFGYDIQGFFRHYWWPDMKSLAWDYGVEYSGVLIETYNDKVKPPFEPEEEGALLRFYASELLHSGGEIGLHGYNHMSLNFEGFEYPPNVNYKLWPSEEDMVAALEELYRYAKLLFPAEEFVTYVPPSNYLSPEGQAVLRKTLPSVRVISGLYLSEAGNNALVQEFGEEKDGSISVPRISSGFIPTEYVEMVIASELALHGVLSHFIHPDDVLDEERGATAGWRQMYAEFKNMLQKIVETYPAIRFATAVDGAAAVQRYERLGVCREKGESDLKISLSNLEDEAWLSLRTHEKITAVEGATLYPVSEHEYWLQTSNETIVIHWAGSEQNAVSKSEEKEVAP